MVIKEGRWGAYVTDGETNASLRQGDAVESITAQRAAELLAERRDGRPVGPPAPGRGEKAGGQETRRQEGGTEEAQPDLARSGPHRAAVEGRTCRTFRELAGHASPSGVDTLTQ